MSSNNTNAEISSNNSPNPGTSNATQPARGGCPTNPITLDDSETICKSLVTKLITIRTSTSRNLDNFGSQTNIIPGENSVNNEINQLIQHTIDSNILETATNGSDASDSQGEAENRVIVPTLLENPPTLAVNVTQNPNGYDTTPHYTIASFPSEPYQNAQNPSSSCETEQRPQSSTRHGACQIHHQATTTNTQVTITPPPFTPRVIQGPPPLAGAPPSYSAIMHLGPGEYLPPFIGRPPIRIQPSPPFIAPPPPPSYSEVQGYSFDRPTLVASVDQMAWGPDPLSVVCPRCAAVVVTSTESQRSNLTHFSALALCLCGCWPCCLLPYCMNSCKNTYHHCPSCQQFLGMYRPW